MASTLLYSEHDYGKVIMDDGSEDIVACQGYKKEYAR